jgi:hypothetical protein
MLEFQNNRMMCGTGGTDGAFKIWYEPFANVQTGSIEFRAFTSPTHMAAHNRVDYRATAYKWSPECRPDTTIEDEQTRKAMHLQFLFATWTALGGTLEAKEDTVAGPSTPLSTSTQPQPRKTPLRNFINHDDYQDRTTNALRTIQDFDNKRLEGHTFAEIREAFRWVMRMDISVEKLQEIHQEMVEKNVEHSFTRAWQHYFLELQRRKLREERERKRMDSSSPVADVGRGKRRQVIEEDDDDDKVEEELGNEDELDEDMDDGGVNSSLRKRPVEEVDLTEDRPLKRE